VKSRALVVFTATAALLAACSSSGPRAATPANTAAAANLQLGAAYLQQGNLPIAKDKLERAVKQSPRDPEIHGMLALLYQRLGDDRRADEEFRTALSLAPKDPDLLNNYAVYLCGQGRVDEGVSRFEAAAANPLYRTPWAAYTNAGVCLRGTRRDAEAEARFERALKVRPDYTEALIQLADLDLRHERAAVAYGRVEAFLRGNPASAEVLLLGWRAARAQQNAIAVAQMAWRLQTEFPESEQARSVAAVPASPH
jgi:type IV pilus assembly protein PilF